jgi:carboxyl-terminal processing protease
LYHADSIKFNDSLKVFTHAKRVVYGGGGIMPDIFVPLDTMMNSKYWLDLRRKGTPNQWMLTYMDANRKNLLVQYPDFETFKKSYVLDSATVQAFVDYSVKQEVPFDSVGYKTSEVLIKTVLRAMLAQNLYSSVGYYYEIINEINNPYKVAIKSINDKTFEKNKIVSNQ